MKTACIVTCGSKKIWGEHPNVGPIIAKFVYNGSLSNKCIN